LLPASLVWHYRRFSKPLPTITPFPLALLFLTILASLCAPLTLAVPRSIITPYRLPLQPRACIRILLTPFEQTQPWLLYLTPGLLAATFIHSLCVTLLARTVRVTLLGPPSDLFAEIAYWRWAIFFVYQALATAWLTPLEVVATRLSVQPNTGGFESVASEEELPEGVTFAGTDEDVIGLRPTTEPYVSLLDCARKVVEEEGWQSLFRGWWWTMGSNVVGVFA